MQQPRVNEKQVGEAFWGKRLKHLKKQTETFRNILEKREFHEVQLPACLPSSHFKSRITGENILPKGPTFVDDTGVQWALCSDQTTFAAHFILESRYHFNQPVRLGYVGKVFSWSDQPGMHVHHSVSQVKARQERTEFGAEIVGCASSESDQEVLELGIEAAIAQGHSDLHVVIGSVELWEKVLARLQKDCDPTEKQAVLEHLYEAFDSRNLVEIFASFGEEGQKEFAEFCEQTPIHKLIVRLKEKFPHTSFTFDPFIVRPRGFYTSTVFEIYSQRNSTQLSWIGGGGRYDELYSHFGRNLPAVGFMLAEPKQIEKIQRPIRIALPKGRLAKKATELFSKVGIVPEVSFDKTRKLVIPSKCRQYEFVLVKNADVAISLERGVADFGIAGSDLLQEHPGRTLTPLTFSFGRCRVCLAGRVGDKEKVLEKEHLDIATKYTRIATHKLAALGMSCDIIKLNGSVELAASLQLSDAIVDLVETGRTLKENNLEVFKDLGETRVYLVVTPGFYYEKASLWQNWQVTWEKENLSEGIQ